MIKVSDLVFSYSDSKVLHQIAFDVAQGHFVSIIGPNGSGKTTLLKNLCKLLKPDSGQIEIDKNAIKTYKSKKLAQKMAVVHQTTESTFDFNVGEVVLMGRYPYLSKFESESIEDMCIAENAMKQTEIMHLKDKSLQSISGGERQRVMIARALAQEPNLLLLDEPISHLDIKYQMEILKLCKRLNSEKALTILTTLHDINLASRFSDKIIMMKAGKIKYIGKPCEVITAANIKEVYDVEVTVTELPFPMIIPV